MKQEFIEDNIIIISKQTIEAMLKGDNPSDLIGLYNFYYYTAKWQKTNMIKCSTNYVSKGMKWSKDRVIKSKKELKEMSLIEDIVRKNKKSGKVSGWYIKLNYIWKKESVSNQRVASPEGGLHQGVVNPDTNALSVNSLNALSVNSLNALSVNNKEDVSKETQKTENPLKEKTNSSSLKEEKNPNPNSANPLSLTKTDTPTKKKSKSYGNEDINNIYGYLKEKLLGTPDGTIKQNRMFAQHLLNKFRKDYPEGDPVVNIRLLIDLAMKDEFHSKNATSFRYLYNNSQKIIQSAKGRFINPKYISFKK